MSSGGAISPNLDETSVQIVQDVATDDYGLRFVMFSWNAGSGQTVNVDLSFKVSILPGYDDYYIKDVRMYLTGASATGTGVVNAAENVWDGFPGGNIVASLSCSKQYDDGGLYLSDDAVLIPLVLIVLIVLIIVTIVTVIIFYDDHKSIEVDIILIAFTIF